MSGGACVSLLRPASLRVAGQHARAAQRRYARRALAGSWSRLLCCSALLPSWDLDGQRSASRRSLLRRCSSSTRSPRRLWIGGVAARPARSMSVGCSTSCALPAGSRCTTLMSAGGTSITCWSDRPGPTRSRPRATGVGSTPPRSIRECFVRPTQKRGRSSGSRGPAEPLLVFSNAYLIPAVSRRDGVLVLPARMLASHLRRRSGNIPAARVTEVYDRLAASLPA